MNLTANLLRLYHVDKQIRGLQSRVQTAERYFLVRKRELAMIDEKRESLLTQSRQLQSTVHNDETEIGVLDARIAKLRDQLNSATTNKQYSSFLTEINTFKADKTHLEERALESMTRFDEVKAQLAELDERRIELVKLRDLAEKEHLQKASDIKERLSELNAVRAAAEVDVPSDLRTMYESEARLREDDVMAPIEEMNRRAMEYCCGACQVLLPMEIVSSSITGATVSRCTSCGAFLYIEEATREAAVPTKH